MQNGDTEERTCLSARVSRSIKFQAEAAVSLTGQSITDFIEAALAEQAQAVIDGQERIPLSERDFARFVELIDQPQPPTQGLKDALMKYRALQAASSQADL